MCAYGSTLAIYLCMCTMLYIGDANQQPLMDSDSVTVTPNPPPNVTVNTVGLDSTPAGCPTKAYRSVNSSQVHTALDMTSWPRLSSVSPNSSTPGSSPLSEFLVLPTAVKKSKPKPASKCARVLTSVELLAILEEKKRKKEEEEEEKLRKKKEREEKKLAKEEEKKFC